MSGLCAVIADDEPLLRRELRDVLAELWPELHIVDDVSDGAAAVKVIRQYAPAVSFLDVRMPKLTGLEVAEQVQGVTHIVFVTAYDQHAIAAFEHGAADYVLKPIKRQRLAATVERLRGRLSASVDAAGVVQQPRLHWIQVTMGATLRFLPIEDVCYFRSDGKYTRVVTAETEAFIRRSLMSLIPALDAAMFWRINRGVVVNVRHIDRVTREDGEMIVRMREDGAELPVSRPHQVRFRGM